jgi:dephospho-CoA kinase
LNDDQEIVRSKLGQIVFHDPEKLKELNSVVHPPMLKRIDERIKHFQTSNESGPLLIDAALIYEWEIEHWFDAVVVVTAPKELRHQRYIQAKGGSAEKLNQREASQISEEIKVKRAEILIHNNQDLDALTHKVNHLFSRNH